MSTQYPALWQFLGAYLHQDWHLDYPDEWAALEDFLEGEQALVGPLVDDVQRVLNSPLSDDEVSDLILREGASLRPEPGTARDWLQRVATRAREYDEAQRRLS